MELRSTGSLFTELPNSELEGRERLAEERNTHENIQPFFGLQFLLYFLVTVNFRAIAQARYGWTIFDGCVDIGRAVLDYPQGWRQRRKSGCFWAGLSVAARADHPREFIYQKRFLGRELRMITGSQ